MSESIWENPKLTAYVLGEMPEAEAAEFESMMQADSALAEAVREVRGVTDQLQVMYKADAGTTLDVARREAITNHQNAPTLAQPDKFSWRIPMTLLATAAALLLLIGAPALLRDSPLSVGQATEDQTDSRNRASTENPQDAASAAKTRPQSEIAREGDETHYQSDLIDLPPLNDFDQNAPSNPLPSSAYLEATIDPSGMRHRRKTAGDQEAFNIAEPSVVAEDGERQQRPGKDPNQLNLQGMSGGARGKAGAVESGQSHPNRTPNPGSGPAAGAASKSVKKRIALDGQPENPAMIAGGLSSNKDFGGGQKMRRDQPADRESTRALRSESTRGLIKGNLDVESDTMGMGMGLDGLGDSKLSKEMDDFIDESETLTQRNRFPAAVENTFKRVAEEPLSTFSVDVDTASYSKIREYLLGQNRRPPLGAVRIEEMVNYFNYEYLPPKDDAEYPFAAKAEIMSCPWNDSHRLARIALKGKEMTVEERPRCNLVFLLDTSGSMNSANKLPLVKEGMAMLLSQLDEKDRVAIVVYAGSAGLVLDSTSAKKTNKIEKALEELMAGGSTNGGAGISLAYQTARDNFIAEGVNRVILCTDGDFNVGTTGTDSLVRIVEEEAKGGIFLSVLGFGMGNHNDEMLENISGRGNGNYAFIDTEKEARKVLVDQAGATLVTIAKDVKLQIEFNPRIVSAYRLIGYENRVLSKEDFNDDKKDAGEIGAGHAVTALYELIPAGASDEAMPPKVDGLKYQSQPQLTNAANAGETLTLKVRYKEPDGDISKLIEFPVVDNETAFSDADHDARFAAAVASFGMQLRRSQYAGDWNLSNVITVAQGAKGEDESGLRSEFVEMVQAASKLMGNQ
ncbi:MAG: VWA domain-containing protein [Rubripirellula sp.]|nr:VWA domain-containing protein [Rubripirellula sp.]